MLIREQTQPAQQPTATTEPAQQARYEGPILHEGTIFTQTSFEPGSSSTPGSSSVPQRAHDVASERLAKFLARESVDPAPKGKGIYIGAGSSDDEDQIIFELKEEIGILNQKLIEKDLLIGTLDIRVSELEKENSQNLKQNFDLQLNLGALTAGYFDLKNKLISEFGNKFKTSSRETSVVETPLSAPAQASQQDPFDDPSPVRTTRIVDRFEVKPA